MCVSKRPEKYFKIFHTCRTTFASRRNYALGSLLCLLKFEMICTYGMTFWSRKLVSNCICLPILPNSIKCMQIRGFFSGGRALYLVPRKGPYRTMFFVGQFCLASGVITSVLAFLQASTQKKYSGLKPFLTYLLFHNSATKTQRLLNHVNVNTQGRHALNPFHPH